MDIILMGITKNLLSLRNRSSGISGMMAVVRQMVLFLAYPESRLDLNSITLILDGCRQINKLWRIDQHSLFLLRACGDSKPLWISDR
jgi:hypothetical protein